MGEMYLIEWQNRKTPAEFLWMYGQKRGYKRSKR